MQKFYAALHATIWSRFAWPTLAAPERMELKINDLCPVSVRRFEADMMKNIEDMYTITYVLYIYICICLTSFCCVSVRQRYQPSRINFTCNYTPHCSTYHSLEKSEKHVRGVYAAGEKKVWLLWEWNLVVSRSETSISNTSSIIHRQ